MLHARADEGSSSRKKAESLILALHWVEEGVYIKLSEYISLPY